MLSSKSFHIKSSFNFSQSNFNENPTTKKQKYNLDRSGDVGNNNGVKLSRTSSQITNFKLLQIYQFL